MKEATGREAGKGLAASLGSAVEKAWEGGQEGNTRELETLWREAEVAVALKLKPAGVS
jgi:hypothetical protein